MKNANNNFEDPLPQAEPTKTASCCSLNQWLILAVAVVVTAVVVGGGVFWLMSNRLVSEQAALEQKITDLQNQITQSQSASEAEGEVDTLNWKTYQNEEYGFMVKYPNEYSVKEINEKNYWYVATYLTEGYENIPKLMNVSVENITQKLDSFVKIMDLQKQGAVSNEKAYGNGYKVDLKFDYISIDGIRSLRADWVWNKIPSGMAAVKESTSYFLYHNDKLYSVAILGLERPDRETLPNQILSTFKFLDTAPVN